MTRSGPIAATAILALSLGFSGTAMGDPFADKVIDLEVVIPPPSSGLSINLDDDDMGMDALGAPDYVPGNWDTVSVLGYDPGSGAGGHIVLAFTDNECVDDFGSDFKIYEAYNGGSRFGNETMTVEVSDDDGETFVEVGEVGPGTASERYELDLDGLVRSFNQIRLTSTSFAGDPDLAGADVDAVECLNSVDVAENGADPGSHVDGCDLATGEEGVDIHDVVAESDGFSIDVNMTLCGSVDDAARYVVAFDYESNERRDDRWYHKKWFRSRWFGGDRHDDDDDDDAEEDDPFGPDTLKNNAYCHKTEDKVAMYYRGREYGVGMFTPSENQLSLSVNYGELGLARGSKLLIWVRTSDRRRIGDSVPTPEAGDRCSRPQMEDEVLAITLE